MLEKNEERKKEYEDILTVDESLQGMSDGERDRLDFAFWASRNVWIKPKGGGRNVRFRPNHAQTLLIRELEKMRSAHKPIRLILLKARQWGGSTAVLVYMAWLQLVHEKGLNALILAHQMSASYEIKDMYDRLITFYGMKEDEDPDEYRSGLTTANVGGSNAFFRIAERGCKIKIGSAERPNAVRGGDYNLVHLSEVGLWRDTACKRAEDTVRAATSGVLLESNTLIIMESTANGSGTYFHHEYLAARDGKSQFASLFIPWYKIKAYQKELDSPERFARWLNLHRNDQAATEREESGDYLYSLWNAGATLEAINWYVEERRKYSGHAAMASEYPSNDIEAFTHSGDRVFAPEAVERLRRDVASPQYVGEMDIDGAFRDDSCGKLKVWKKPDIGGDPGLRWAGRYMVVVDIGGRSDSSDWSVIAVIDRVGSDGKRPEIVAQWRGHTDHDLLAQNAARIGRWYLDALLVIESNTLETHDPYRYVDGNSAPYLLAELDNDYPNLYRRYGREGDRKAGFHTNRQSKTQIIGQLVKAVRDGLYVERDNDAIDELIQYERRRNGRFGASIGCHDDILMTRAIGLYIHEHEAPPPRRVKLRSPKSRTPRLNSGSAFGF